MGEDNNPRKEPFFTPKPDREGGEAIKGRRVPPPPKSPPKPPKRSGDTSSSGKKPKK